MKIALLVTSALPEEWLASPLFHQSGILLLNRLEDLTDCHADAVIDFEPEPSEERLRLLEAKLPAVTFVNAVTKTLAEIGRPFIRFNGWPGFGGGKIWELAAGTDEQQRGAAVLTALEQSYTFVSDVVGLITPRIVTMIIAEARLTLQEGVGTREAIDAAMKLGTGYPYGPFEWAEKIGKERVDLLLAALENTDPLYRMPPELHSL